MRAQRVDANHSLIVQAARRAGLRVQDTSMVGAGFGDVAVQNSSGIVEIWEIKDYAKPASRRKFTRAQETSRQLGWKIRLVMTLDDVLTAQQEMLANAAAIANARRVSC